MANPLTAEDKKVIDANLARLKEAEEEVARAKLAGFDVTEEERQVQELKTQLQKIKQAYFPRT